MSKTEVTHTQPKTHARKRMSATYVDQLSDARSMQQNDQPNQTINQDLTQEATFAWPFVVYQLTICMPIFIYVGASRVAPYKIILLLAFLPCVIKVIMSKQTSLKLGDALIVGYTAMAAISIMINKSWTENTIEPVLSIVLETSGSYFLARAFVNSPAAFKILIQTQLLLVIIVGLFSCYEAISGTNILFKFFGIVFQTFAISDMATRLGLHRAQGTFEHPILYGVYSSMAFGLCFYGLKTTHTTFQRYRRLALVRSRGPSRERRSTAPASPAA